ncbi:MAG: TauD/TfdA dioxygenase family protein [Burkholderiales bacterium]
MQTLHPDFGVELPTLPAPAALDAALRQHALVVVRDTRMTDEALVALGNALGRIDGGVKRFTGEGPSPDQRWHHVGAIVDAPARATLLYPEIAAPGAPGMQFVSMRAAWRALPIAEQQAIAGRVGVHTFRSVPGQRAAQPLVFSPRHDAETALFVGYHAVGIEGMANADAQRLLTALMAQATTLPRIYTHVFQPGDFVAWDNRALMHRACALPAGANRAVREIAIH